MLHLFEQVFPNHAFRWIKHGQTAKGFCPFHSDQKNRSLSIYLDDKGRQRWHCFSEGIGSTEVDLVKRAFNISRDAANRWLISKGYLQENELDMKERIHNDALQAFYEYTNRLLVEDPKAAGLRAYIAGRGVKASLLSKTPIGYYPSIEDIQVWLESNNIPEELYSEFLPAKSLRDMAEGSIAFFYRCSYDRWYRVKLRNPLKEGGESDDKAIIYLGKNKKAFNGFFAASNEFVQSEHAIVVEGEFDVLSLFAMCKTHDPDSVEPIFCFGSGGNMANGIPLLTNVGIENIYVFPDNDGPGVQYSFDIAENYPHTFIIFPEEYADKDDPAAWSKNHGFDALQSAFRRRIPAFEWIGKQLAQEFQNGSTEDQSHAKEKVLQYAKKLSPSNKELFLRSYAPLTGASYESLCEEVQDYEKLKYKKVLSVDGFGVWMRIEKGEKVEWEHISNIVIECTKDVLLDEGDDQPTRNMSLRISTMNTEKTMNVTAKQFVDDRALLELLQSTIGSSLWIKPKTIIYLRESVYILSNANAQMEEVIYMHTGWREDKFIMPGGYVDEEGFHELGDIKVELPKNPVMFQKYFLMPPPADMTFMREVILEDMLKVFPYEITLPIVAHLFLAPVLHFIEANPYCLWVQGMTGSYKTSYIAMMNSFYGNFSRGDAIETWRSTGNAIEKNGYYLKDVPYIVDDYKKIDVNDKYVTSLIQSYGDGHGRSRLRSDSTQQKTWSIRALLAVTGEDLPTGEASVLARTLVVPIKVKGDSEKLTRGQLYAKNLPGVMSKYLQFLASKHLNIEVLTALLREKQRGYTGCHERAIQNIALNSIGFEMFAEFFECPELLPVYHEAMKKIATNMDKVTRGERACEIYIDSIRELLSTGGVFLEGVKGENSTPHMENARKIGWITPTNVLLLGSTALAEASAFRNRVTGNGIKYSAQAIYDQLESEKVIELHNGKPTYPVRIDAQTHRVVRFKRGVLEGYETTSNADEPESSEIRIEENCTELD